MNRINLQIPPDEDGHPVGRVEVDTFDDGEIFLEVIDESPFNGTSVKAVIPLNAEQARLIADALAEAADLAQKAQR